MPAKTPFSKTPDQPTFEHAIERLEEIVAQMENEKLPLEDLLLRYEEGIKLVAVCGEKLDAAEKKIQMITRDAAGAPQLSEFDAPEKSAASQDPGAALF